jgi:cytochrome o ubiquinol oxidase subunit 1
MIWYIWWLAIVAFVGIVGYAIWHSFDYDRDFHIPAAEVTRVEDQRTAALAAGA